MLAWEAMAQGAYSENTKRAWRADWEIFKAFCEAQGVDALPALPVTVRHLQTWIKGAKVANGALFRRIIGRQEIGERLHSNIVADIYKRVGRRLNLADEEITAISWHSVRVGATQDLLALI